MTQDQQTKVEEPTYPVDRLIAEAEDFFGQPPHVVAGALANQRKQNFTKPEVERAMNAFLKAEVDYEG